MTLPAAPEPRLLHVDPRADQRHVAVPGPRSAFDGRGRAVCWRVGCGLALRATWQRARLVVHPDSEVLA